MSNPQRVPLLLELGTESWDHFMDKTAGWLRNVQLAQTSFRHLAEETAEKEPDPRVKEMIERIAETARSHEQKVDELYKLIGREPSNSAGLLGEVTARGRQVVGDVLGLMGGARGPWHDLRQMLLANLNTIGAFGAVEQIGLTLGLPELAQTAFVVVREKSTEQLVMEEFMLELAPQSILYDDREQPSTEGQTSGTHEPPAEPPGMQPQFPGMGTPEDALAGNQMGGDRRNAAHEQHQSSDTGNSGTTPPGTTT